jgi:hypothetical protein
VTPNHSPITYQYEIGDNLRIRNHIERIGNDITHFAVTLEYCLDGAWCPVVRFDTSGGEVHRDRLKPDGGYLTHREPVRLGVSWHDAVQAARIDLTRRLDWYVSEFLKHVDK